MVNRTINMIIIHCAATKPDMDVGVKEITQWHKARGFFTIGYHYVIRRDGTLETGRDINLAGAHAIGYNEHSVGICLVGGIDDKGRPQNNFTDKQWATLKTLVKELVAKYKITEIIGHNQVTKKACPCFSVPAWLKNNMEKV